MLFRSIILNVFTKVIRVSNLDVLGEKIVVQGGTFENDAVLRAMEQCIGRPVTRAPYPGIMGAIGAALIAKEEHAQKKTRQQFIGLDRLETLTWKQEADVPCPFCTNHCHRAIVTFSNGNAWITNNRCEKGEIIGDPKDQKVRTLVKEASLKKEKIPDLYELRKKLLFADYLPEEEKKNTQNITIGIPRVLMFWETMPFWTTFWQKLGFRVQISSDGSHQMFEEGLSAVTSDTVCFPAKLVHGHIRDLAHKHVDRIFFPSIAEIASENTEETSESMCAIVKGYPLVIKNSDSPEEQWGIPLDTPLFYWNREEDKKRQLTEYMKRTFSMDPAEVEQAIQAGNAALEEISQEIKRCRQKGIGTGTERTSLCGCSGCETVSERSVCLSWTAGDAERTGNPGSAAGCIAGT